MEEHADRVAPPRAPGDRFAKVQMLVIAWADVGSVPRARAPSSERGERRGRARVGR
jgi:hypothetical protein